LKLLQQDPTLPEWTWSWRVAGLILKPNGLLLLTFQGENQFSRTPGFVNRVDGRDWLEVRSLYTDVCNHVVLVVRALSRVVSFFEMIRTHMFLRSTDKAIK
jgi:hypothetical protein